MSIATTTEQIQDEQIEFAIAEFNEGLSVFDYEAVMYEMSTGWRRIVVWCGNDEVAEFWETDTDWIGSLQDYAYKVELGAMTA